MYFEGLEEIDIFAANARKGQLSDLQKTRFTRDYPNYFEKIRRAFVKIFGNDKAIQEVFEAEAEDRIRLNIDNLIDGMDSLVYFVGDNVKIMKIIRQDEPIPEKQNDANTLKIDSAFKLEVYTMASRMFNDYYPLSAEYNSDFLECVIYVQLVKLFVSMYMDEDEHKTTFGNAVYINANGFYAHYFKNQNNLYARNFIDKYL